MNQDLSPQDSKPWYKIPIVWLVIIIPASSVVLGLALVVIASINADDVVVDDWYKQGKTINRSLDEEAIAERFGLSVDLALDEDHANATLTAKTAIAWPETLHVALRHPTFSAKDQTLALSHQGDGEYQGDAIDYDGQESVIMITPNDKYWRLQQRVSMTGETITVRAKEKK